MNLDEILSCARGDLESDLVIKNVWVPNVFTFEITQKDVALYKDTIVGVGKDYQGKTAIDGRGKYLVPGFIDGHCHIESTMLTPEGFAELVVPRGTTSVFADPHEIANTSGMSGMEYMDRASSNLPLDIYLNAPSCVPASSFETPFETLDGAAIEKMFRKAWCFGLGEMMNYPGVLKGDKDVWAKILASHDQVRTGHAPGLRGKDLCAYLMSRCASDHESVTLEEALEKLSLGMWVMIREGAEEHNLKDLAPLVAQDERRSSRVMMVSDDLTVSYIFKKGHMDEKIRMAQGFGISPVCSIRMATLSPADYFGLKDLGAIAPGYRGDMVLLDSLEDCKVSMVFKDGVLVAEGGKLLKNIQRQREYPSPSKDIKLPKAEDLAIKASGEKIRVIGIKKGQVVTEHRILEPTLKGSEAVSDPSRDLAKMVVVDRNQNSGRLGLGFVQGMSLKRGAIGSSVAHDAHNFLAIGTNDEDMVAALEKLRSMGGGLTAVLDGRILGSLGLPVGGLMSDKNPKDLASEYDELEKAVRELGCPLEHPFMAASFLSLSVIPSLKLTDQGYVDLSEGGSLKLFL